LLSYAFAIINTLIYSVW